MSKYRSLLIFLGAVLISFPLSEVLNLWQTIMVCAGVFLVAAGEGIDG